MIDLRNSIRDADNKIKQLKREKKDLEVQQFRRERKMEKIIDPYGEPDNMKSVNDAQKELEVITDKVKLSILFLFS
jgi:peptidoglycan hydrolase CwlO-like protein